MGSVMLVNIYSLIFDKYLDNFFIAAGNNYVFVSHGFFIYFSCLHTSRVNNEHLNLFFGGGEFSFVEDARCQNC